MIPLQQVVSRLETVKAKHGIEPALKEIACEFQAGNIAFQLEPDMSTPSDIPIAFVTYSKEWESRYRDREYLEIDPVARGLDRSLPFDWKTVAGAASKRWLFREAVSFGVGRQGVSIPMRGKGNIRALITITSFESDREWQKSRWRHQTLISALAPCLHELVLTLHKFQPDRVLLSERQRQCLELYGRGNAPKQIAARLGISGSMTRRHLHLARRKLGSLSVSSAVLKAAKLDIVDI